MPKCIVGYDVIVWVGKERFLNHRQAKEIRPMLKKKFGRMLSLREINYLARRFLVYLKELHEERAPALRALLAKDGGWPLHVDATCEDGRGTLLVAFAGWRRWVLGSWKIPTEREDQILPHLRWIVKLFGSPCALMRDMGRAVLPATESLVAELPRMIPLLLCHQHFVKDIGKDLLKPSYKELRDHFREAKILTKLASLARDLGRKVGSDIGRARKEIRDWLESEAKQRILPAGATGLAAVRVIAQWVLDYSVEGDNLRFPFDRPYLDLYRRCLNARRAVDDFLRKPSLDDAVEGALMRLARVLEPVVSQVSFARTAKTLQTRAKLLDELRDVLRIDPVVSLGEITSTSATGKDVAEAMRELDQIRRALEDYRASLQKRRPKRGPAEDKRNAIDLIETHLKRYGDSLWGHAILLPKLGIRLVDRTNNLLEMFFNFFKHGERRRSGRKVLTKDLEDLPAEAVLALNLLHSDYVEALCGSLEQLPDAFAELDGRKRAAKLKGALPQPQDPLFTPPKIASASLPKEDRKFVRASDLGAMIFAAARSRAPRVQI